MKTILVTGANGQLGREIKKLENNYSGFKFIFTDIEELDITISSDVDLMIKDNNVTHLINCAAYTAVDKAETEKETAYLLNSDAVKILAQSAKKHNVVMIHVSTDYVFDGKNFRPYTEKDQTKPNSVYGFTKLKGEEEFIKSRVNGIIIRTSWLYSEFGNNFVKTMLRLGKERESINVISDQIGTPTYAFDLAKAIIDIIKDNKVETQNILPQIYHYSNEGACSWYDFTKEIIEYSRLNCEVNAIESSDYPQIANRPHYSVLNKTLIKNTFDLKIPYWNESLKNCLDILISKKD